MKHLIFLLLLTSQLISCSKITGLFGEEEVATNNSGGASPAQKDTVGDNGKPSDTNNGGSIDNSSNSNGSILDNVFSTAVASTSLIEQNKDDGCENDLIKLKIRTSIGQYDACFKNDSGYYGLGTNAEIQCTRSGLTLCLGEEVMAAVKAGYATAPTDGTYLGAYFWSLSQALNPEFHANWYRFTGLINNGIYSSLYRNGSESASSSVMKNSRFYCCYR